LNKYVNKTNNTIILRSRAVVGSKIVDFFPACMSSACRPTQPLPFVSPPWNFVT